MKSKSKSNPIPLIGRIILTGTLFLLFSSNLEAQQSEKTDLSKLNIYVDAGVHLAGQFSINVEGQIFSGEKLTWYGRAGFGYAYSLFEDEGPGFLGAITMLTGKKNNHFEVNGGAFIGEGYGSFVFPILDLGYRYQKPKGGFIFKAKAGILGIGIGLGVAF